MNYTVARMGLEPYPQGVHRGRPAFVVRLVPRGDNTDGDRESVASLIAAMAIVAEPDTFLVLRGATERDEPAEYRLDPLILAARANGYPVALDTGGWCPLPRSVDWLRVMLPPSLPVIPSEALRRANEVCLSVDCVETWRRFACEGLRHCRERAVVWVRPSADAALRCDVTEWLGRDARLRFEV